jgi:hypothetical protein
VEPGGLATGLGLLHQAVSRDGGELLVLVRPDDVDLVPARNGNGTVVERVFRGMHYRYRVRLDSGEDVKCLADHCVDVPAGARVLVRVRACHPLACFAEGVNIPSELIATPEEVVLVETADLSPWESGR